MIKYLAVTLALMVVVGVWWFFPPVKGVENYTDITISMSGEIVNLVDGVGETESMMGESGKTTVRYFGNDAIVDFDRDGRDDVVFLVTQETGGSGTFFYLVGARNTASGYVGTAAVLIGDRIAPQITEARPDGTIIVNYADRAPGEPFTAQPSLGKSLYLKYDTASNSFGEVVQNFEGEER